MIQPRLIPRRDASLEIRRLMKNGALTGRIRSRVGGVPRRAIILNHDITAAVAGPRLIKTASVSGFYPGHGFEINTAVYGPCLLRVPKFAYSPLRDVCVHARARARTPVIRPCVYVCVCTRRIRMAVPQDPKYWSNHSCAMVGSLGETARKRAVHEGDRGSDLRAN